IHRRIGIVVETLGDLEALIQAGRAEGYDADEPIANNRNGNNPIYIYFERGSNKPAPPEHPATHEGRCPECLQTVPANESGRAPCTTGVRRPIRTPPATGWVRSSGLWWPESDHTRGSRWGRQDHAHQTPSQGVQAARSCSGSRSEHQPAH